MKKSSAQGSEDPILQWVTFRLDNETYGINVMRVQEVLRYTEIAPVPGAPSYVLGTDNFYAVTRYNWSSYYALAVLELGQAVQAQWLRQNAP